MWDFLSNPENRAVLAWLGSGLCILAGGLWAVFKHFSDRRSSSVPKPEPKVSVSGRDGVMTGGDLSVTGGIRIGDVALPRLTLGLAALGMVLLFLALILGGGETTTSNSVTVGRDMKGSTISVGGPDRPEEARPQRE